MLHSKSRLLTPIAAALALALASGGAIAATNNNPQSQDAYREGQLWATYVINPALQSYDIKADVQGDTVTLTGTVDAKPEKWLAEHIAQHVKGITKVDNEINVDQTHIVVTTFVPASVFAQHVRNATTSATINAQLLANEYTDGLDVKVVTRNGKVTLTGTADTPKAKQRAGQIAARTVGVRSVDNQLTADNAPVGAPDYEVGDDWITDRLQSSYMFTAGMDSADIDIDVNDGVVSLSGTVDSRMERGLAIGIAQDIRGVVSVKADGLRVSRDTAMNMDMSGNMHGNMNHDMGRNADKNGMNNNDKWEMNRNKDSHTNTNSDNNGDANTDDDSNGYM